MIREEGEYGGVVAEHLLGEAVERLLRANLDEDAGAVLVQSPKAFHELNRRSDLVAQNGDHLRFDASPHRVEVAAQVGDDGDLRRGKVQPRQRLLQRH